MRETAGSETALPRSGRSIAAVPAVLFIASMATLAGLAVPLLITDTVSRAATVVAVMVVFVSAAWFAVLDEDERMLIRRRMGWAVADMP